MSSRNQRKTVSAHSAQSANGAAAPEFKAGGAAGVTSERAPKREINVGRRELEAEVQSSHRLPWPTLGNLTFVMSAAGLPYRNSRKVTVLHHPPVLALSRRHNGAEA